MVKLRNENLGYRIVLVFLQQARHFDGVCFLTRQVLLLSRFQRSSRRSESTILIKENDRAFRRRVCLYRERHKTQYKLMLEQRR